MRTKVVQLIAILLVVCVSPFFVQSACAASIAGASIEVDGGHVAGYTITRSNETRDDLVAQLSRRALTFERSYKIPVDEKDPTLAVLTGRIRLISKIGRDDQVMATVEALHLVKRNSEWFVEAESLERALKKPAEGEGKPGP